MNIHKVKEIINSEVICGKELLDMDVKMVCGGDLMSHVLEDTA